MATNTDAISRSAVLKIMENDLLLHESEVEIVEEICTRVRELPALDVAPVVRCKDCQYAIPLDGHAFRRWGNNALNCTECRGDDGFGMAGVSLAYHDGFCDRGVRRGRESHD